MLESVSSLGKPVSVRELVHALELDAEARRQLKTVLRRLIDQGALVKIRGARVGLPDRMNLVVGRLSCSPAGHGFVIPELRREGQGDIFVAPANIREALHGDRVVARVERHGPKGAEGRIIRVLDRANQRIVGRYESDGRFGGRVVPFDRRVLHEVFVPAGEEGGATAGAMVAAEITRPPTATRNPAGRVTLVLGQLSDPGVDLKVIVAKYALPDAFPPEVEAEAESVARPVTAAEAASRTDFRGWLTVTIDPETARDHDDAVGIERRPDGGYRLAVHIADVAHYVREGGALDQEAYLRGTSVYFPDRVVPMLPHALSSDVCSLVEGKDRLTQTVVIDLDANGKVERTAFHDGLIKSAARLSYQQAQAIVSGDAAARERFARLVEPLARDGRAREEDEGAPLRARLARLRPARAQAGARRCGGDDRDRAPRAARQHAPDRGVHAGRERGRGREAPPRGGGCALPDPRAARPRADRGVRGPRRPRSATACRRTPRASARSTSSWCCARSRASRKRSSCPTCCCAR